MINNTKRSFTVTCESLSGELIIIGLSVFQSILKNSEFSEI